MVIYLLTLIILTKKIFQFLRVSLTYHPKLCPHHIKKKLINNHADGNKGKIKGKLYREDIFGFCESFKKVNKNLGFHLMLKTANLQDTLYTSMADDINVTNNNLCLYIPNLIPSVET